MNQCPAVFRNLEMHAERAGSLHQSPPDRKGIEGHELGTHLTGGSGLIFRFHFHMRYRLMPVRGLMLQIPGKDVFQLHEAADL